MGILEGSDRSPDAGLIGDDSAKTTPQVALITAANLPKPDQDSDYLIAALESLGISVALIPWTEERDWSSTPLVVLRTPWDYVERYEAFLEWCETTAVLTRFVNAPDIIRWNIRKTYLFDLQAAGVPVIPTKLFPQFEGGTGLGPLLGDDADVVIKPAVSVGSIGTKRGRSSRPEMAAHLHELRRGGDAILQPFAPHVIERGEASLIYLEGGYSHAVLKRPAAGDFRVQDHHGGTLHDYEPTPAEFRVAEQAIAAAPAPPVYARVDLVDWEGQPAVMELEVIEPELFLRRHPASALTFAKAIQRRLNTVRAIESAGE